LRITAGAGITWTNRDEILHTATAGVPGAPTELFDGLMDGAGTTFRFAFGAPGTYAYFCSRHPSMRGEIVVA
jgi:plastocyanin